MQDTSTTDENKVTEARSGIEGSNLQEALDSGSNAGAKGQSQFYTPFDFGEAVCLPLPDIRPQVIDLNCGNGQLLHAAAGPDTLEVFGIDIDGKRIIERSDIDGVRYPNATYRRIKLVSDITVAAPVFNEIDFRADLFVLNPPWDVHWYKDRLDFLGGSHVAAVARAFQKRDDRLGKDKIDSTAATLMMGLHFCSERGEGVVIANNNTLQRLIFKPGAPYADLACHIWAHVIVPGNPMTGIDGHQWDDEFNTGIIYFAASHFIYPQFNHTLREGERIDHLLNRISRLKHRNGVSINVRGQCTDSSLLFQAAASEVRSRRTPNRTDYNIWLEPDGTIARHLSTFDEKRITGSLKKVAAELNELQGKTPMQLVMQRHTRNALLAAVRGNTWRVAPGLVESVDRAIAEYHSNRAPFVKLTPVQRLGFLDEQEKIFCTKSFGRFKAGESYPLSASTITVERTKSKPTHSGNDVDLLLNGQELLIQIDGCNFLDRKYHSREIFLSQQVEGKEKEVTPQFTLDDIINHFDIPEVPDVAECRPDEYADKLALFDDIVSAIKRRRPNFRARNFQREDLTRSVMHPGLVFAWDTGLGKTLAFVFWSLLQVGHNDLTPKAPVLLIAPGSLHQQIRRNIANLTGITDIVPLMTQQDYLDLTEGGTKPLRPAFYITSYTAFTNNGTDRPRDPYKLTPAEIDDYIHRFHVTDQDLREAKKALISQMLSQEGGFKVANEYEKLPLHHINFRRSAIALKISLINNEDKVYPHGRVACVDKPSLMEYSRHEFRACCIDEGTRIKSLDSQMGMGVRRIRTPHRCVLTATPIKNRLGDLFFLLAWACDSMDEANARFPYKGTEEQLNDFTAEFMVCQRDVTGKNVQEVRRQMRNKKGRGRGKPTAEVCNLHRIWKMIGACILRRRKADIGEEIVSKVRRPIRVPMGLHQSLSYKYHLDAKYEDINGKDCLVAKMQALRAVAAAPTSSNLLPKPVGNGSAMKVLEKVGERAYHDRHRSRYDYTPKVAAALNVIADRMIAGEQSIVFSAFHEPMDTISRRLAKASIPHHTLDGRMSEVARGRLAEKFSAGLPEAVPVINAGMSSMGEGHSFPRCNNIILICFDWAWNLYEQAINRAHRLDSIRDVNVWPIICEGSIDVKLESLNAEKGDSSGLVIDGKLIGEDEEEVNLFELLKIAHAEFANANTLDERKLEDDWPALMEKLAHGWRICKSLTAPPKTSSGAGRILSVIQHVMPVYHFPARCFIRS